MAISLSAALISVLLCPQDAASESALPHFATEVRPILARRCFACHGNDEDTREAGLRLDSFAEATLDRDGFPAVKPGAAADSELIARITDEFDPMPPEEAGEPLTEAEVDILRRWIDGGAEYAPHWSFTQPIAPAIELKAGELPIDALVAAQHATRGLTWSPEADDFTLYRRISLDLTGLPPTPEAAQAYAASTDPGKYERAVDELLASPDYAERWTAVWLDLARYADSSGHGSDPLRTIWRYRDWVVDAFDKNMPFDEFTVQQLAGDLLPDADVNSRLATAFHRNTMTNTEGGTDNEEFRVLAVKDRVNTTMSVWMGLTAGCAECHSHKFDPISHVEYYQLFDIFNQTADADIDDDRPRLATPSLEEAAREAELKAELAAADGALAEFMASADPLELESQGESLLLEAGTVRIELAGGDRILSLAEVELLDSQGIVIPLAFGSSRQSSTAYDGAADRAIDGNSSGTYSDGSVTHTQTEVDPWWEGALVSPQPVFGVRVWPRTDSGLAERTRGFHVLVLDPDGKEVWRSDLAPAPRGSGGPGPEEFDTDGKPFLDVGPGAWQSRNPVFQALRIDRDAVATRMAAFKPTTTPVMEELPADKRRTTNVLTRGNFLQKEDEVSAAVPAVFPPLPDGVEANRLALAKWLVSDSNPLTARVTVNRVWARLFGRGLVLTEGDFGSQGDLPSHPQLLDWLSVHFKAGGWDHRELLRTIVTSRTYRQSSNVEGVSASLDPEAKWLSRYPRQRLEAEMVRDTGLEVAGLLSRKRFGPSVFPPQPEGLWKAAFNGQRKWRDSMGEDRYRRGVYVFLRRTIPYPMLATFDAPSRETCTVRRIPTNTPLQAFVTLNDPVFVEASQGLAQRALGRAAGLSDSAATHEQVLEEMLWCAVSRAPEASQVNVLLSLYEDARDSFTEDPEAAAAFGFALPDGDDPASPESAAWTLVASAVLNLDAVLTKE